MEIRVFTNRPEMLEYRYPHSNELFCGDQYEDADFPYLYLTNNLSIIIVGIIDDVVVGGIQLSYCEDGWILPEDVTELPKWSMMGIGINDGYRGKGYSRSLIDKQFDVMDECGIDYICQSGYSEQGLKTIFNSYQRMIEKNPHINYINGERLF